MKPFHVARSVALCLAVSVGGYGCGTTPVMNSYTSAAPLPVTGIYACADADCQFDYAEGQAAAHINIYQTLAARSAKGDRLFSNSALLGGIYTAGALLFESDPGGISNAVKDNLTGVGLVLAAASAYRGGIRADERAEFFLKSRDASICVLRRGAEAERRAALNTGIATEVEEVTQLLVALKGLKAIGYDDPKLDPAITRVEAILSEARLQLESGRDAPSAMMKALDDINRESYTMLKGEPIDISGVSQALYDAGTQSRNFTATKDENATDAANAVTQTFTGNMAALSSTDPRDVTIAALINDVNQYVISLGAVQTRMENVATQVSLIEACPAVLVDQNIPDPETKP